ncbi:hypothetical protein GEMRC1_006405 [Eukaryota sp. GEM-RC1]
MDASALNRNATGTLADIGKFKCDVLAEFLPMVLPDTKTTVLNEYCSPETSNQIFDWKPDYVICAFDNLPTLEELVVECRDRNIKVIVSCGAACKCNMSLITYGDISDVVVCKMGKALKSRLSKRGIKRNVNVVFSTEPIVAEPLKADAPTEATTNQSHTGLRFRRSKLPSMMQVPACFGHALAAWVISDVCNFQFETSPLFFGRSKLYRSLIKTSMAVGLDCISILSENDVEEIVECCFRGSSPLSKISSKLVFCPWDPEKGKVLDNLVLMTEKEAKQHVVLPSVNVFPYEKDVLEYTEKLLKESGEYLASRGFI